MQLFDIIKYSMTGSGITGRLLGFLIFRNK